MQLTGDGKLYAVETLNKLASPLSPLNSSAASLDSPSQGGLLKLVMNNIPDCLYTQPAFQQITAIHVYMASCTLPYQVCMLC